MEWGNETAYAILGAIMTGVLGWFARGVRIKPQMDDLRREIRTLHKQITALRSSRDSTAATILSVSRSSSASAILSMSPLVSPILSSLRWLQWQTYAKVKKVARLPYRMRLPLLTANRPLRSKLATLERVGMHDPGEGIAEDVWVVPAVEPPFQFLEIAVNALEAHLVECADDGALEEAPDALYGVGMHVADNPLVSGMVDRLVTREGVAGSLSASSPSSSF